MTQTVTQKPRGQESTGEGRMASSVPLRLFFCGLHGLADDAADGVGGGAPHPLRGVSVGAEGKADGRAAVLLSLADPLRRGGAWLL